MFGNIFCFISDDIGNAIAGSERDSVIYEDRIVWQDDSNGNWDIQMYNVSTSTEDPDHHNGETSRILISMGTGLFGRKLAMEGAGVIGGVPLEIGIFTCMIFPLTRKPR